MFTHDQISIIYKGASTIYDWDGDVRDMGLGLQKNIVSEEGL